MKIDITSDNIVEEIYIKDYRNFSVVEEKYYGGYQGWLTNFMLTSKFWADRACGVVAAANISAYKSRELNIPSIYPYKTRNKVDFTSHIYDVFKFINPAFYGVPTIGNMVKGFVKFGQSRGVKLEPVYFRNKWNLENIITYIKNGLQENNPVMLVTWNTNVKDLKNHWITITGFVRTKDGKSYIVTSNWGRIATYSLDDWFKNYSLYKGLIYFKVAAN